MDINIPIMNGLKVIQLSRLKHPNTAFVIVSGYDDFSYCREALRLQITDYILKPVNYEEFGTCIDNLKHRACSGISAARGRRTCQEERPIHEPHAVFAGAFGRGSEPWRVGGGISPESPVHQPAVQKRDRRQFPERISRTSAWSRRKSCSSDHRSLPIAEISEQSGYADYRVFTKVLKKSEGVTPSQYRRDFLEQNA